MYFCFNSTFKFWKIHSDKTPSNTPHTLRIYIYSIHSLSRFSPAVSVYMNNIWPSSGRRSTKTTDSRNAVHRRRAAQPLLEQQRRARTEEHFLAAPFFDVVICTPAPTNLGWARARAIYSSSVDWCYSHHQDHPAAPNTSTNAHPDPIQEHRRPNLDGAYKHNAKS